MIELARGRRYPWYRRFLTGRWLWGLFVLLLVIHGLRMLAWSRDGTLERDDWLNQAIEFSVFDGKNGFRHTRLTQRLSHHGES